MPMLYMQLWLLSSLAVQDNDISVSLTLNKLASVYVINLVPAILGAGDC